MQPKTNKEIEIYEQMLAMLADQFYHQPGDRITINRMEFADMLAKQTMHGIELGGREAAEWKKIARKDARIIELMADGHPYDKAMEAVADAT